MAGLVQLNVGGTLYDTSRMTLLGGGGASFFSGLLGDTGAALRGAGSYAPASAVNARRRKRADADGPGDDEAPEPLFIDRSGALFAPILEFLRTGSLPAAYQDDRAALSDLSKEAAYYLIDPLIKHIAERQRVLASPLADVWGVKLPSAQGHGGGSVVEIDVPEGREITITRVPNGTGVGKGFRQFVYLSADGVDRLCIAALSGAGPSAGADEASAATAPTSHAGGVQQVNVDIRLRRKFSLINEIRGCTVHVLGYIGPPTLPNAPQPLRGTLLY